MGQLETKAAPAKKTTQPAPKGAAPVPTITLPQAIKDGMDPLLHRILSTPRGFPGDTEKAFNTWLVNQIKAYGAEVRQVELGQIVVEIAQPEGAKRVMFACHTDTVDDPKITGTKTLEFDPDFERVTLAKESVGDCLGADDGAGVWMLLKMIQAKVPGTYVFHRGEERGCVGANALKGKASAWLQEFDVAVEFDRPGDTEIITHQGGQRCASDTFGRALSKALEPVVSLDMSQRGLLTDVRVYRTLIPEVVNIGVGYRGHHGRGEELDVGYLEKLLTAVKAVDWGDLPVERDPTHVDPPRQYGSPFPTTLDRAGWNNAPTPVRPATPPPPRQHFHAEDGWEDCTMDDLRHYMDMQDGDEAAAEVAKLLIRIEGLKAENAQLRQLLGL